MIIDLSNSNFDCPFVNLFVVCLDTEKYHENDVSERFVAYK